MTNESEPNPEAPEAIFSYYQFAVPGVPYSAVRGPLSPEWIDFGMEMAQRLAEKYQAAFPQDRPTNYDPQRNDGPYGPVSGDYEREPYPERNDAPRGRQEPRQGGSRPSSGLLCPTHHIGLVETIAKYQEYDDGPNGEKVPAKFFCPGKENGTGQNHSVWRSQAVPA